MARERMTAEEMAKRLIPGSSEIACRGRRAAREEMECSTRKRINLNVTAEQHLKLRRYALERNMTVSDILREYIDSLGC